MQYAVHVPMEVVDGGDTAVAVVADADGPVLAEGCTQTFTPRLARDDPLLPVDGQRRRVKQRQATEATADALAALPVDDTERSPSPEDPLFAADGKDAVVEAPVATARAISEEEAVEEAIKRSLYDQ